MSVSLGDGVVTAAFVSLLVAGSAASFLLYEGLTAMNPDERELSHEYLLEGTCDGDPCRGYAVSEYIGFSGGYRLYTLSIGFESEGFSGKETLNLIFDEKDRLDITLYTLLGETDLDGKRVTAWMRQEKGIDYTILVSENCLLESISMSSPHLELIGGVV